MSKNHEEISDGCMGAIVVSIFVIAGIMVFADVFAGKGHQDGIRGTLSADWHHAKCLVKLCDDDGRCPVWSSEYSKCYMLYNGAKEFLLEFQKETKKETFEEVFVK